MTLARFVRGRCGMDTSPEAGESIVDLTNCDQEQIHIPGRIQSHGLLLALREDDLAVIQTSANVGELLGISPDAILGTPFDALIEPSRRDWRGPGCRRRTSRK